MAMSREDDVNLRLKFVQVYKPTSSPDVCLAKNPHFHVVRFPKKHMLQRDFPLLSIWYGHYSDDEIPQLTIAAPEFSPPTDLRFGTLGTLIGTYPWPEAWRVLFAHVEFFK